MGRFDDSIVNDYAGAASNPAAPGALQQIATEAGAVQTGKGRFADSYVGQYVVDEGLTAASKSWYGGPNMAGVSNSWDTGFMAEAFKQFDEQQAAAAETGDGTKFFDWFDRKDATGVALWDDQARGIERGDVFNNGQKAGNVYKDFDAKTANVMLAEFTLDRDTKAKIFADPDRDRWLGDEVTKQLDANTAIIGDAAAGKAFGEAVDARQEGVLEGKSEAALVLGGAAGGGTVGAGLGSFFGPIGTGVGGVVGTAFGAGSAYLNRDQLSEQVARAMEVTSLANERFGAMATAGTAAKEFGGVGMRFISPVSNSVQGIYDATQGKGGDGESEFYAVDEDGKRKAPTWVKIADVAAAVADGAGQFGTRAGVGLYLGSTGASVTGSIGQLAGSGGYRWNDYEADFTQPEGGGQWAATVGSIGIDAVQMGFGAAVARAGVGARAALGADVATPSRVTQAFNRLAPWRSADEVSSATINGMRFGLNESGEAVSRRVTLGTFVAPSEALRYVPTAMKARMRAASSRGEVATADDYYRAALESVGGHGVGAALVNGWAESAEEAVQGILDPVSFGKAIDTSTVLEQAAYGFAGGFGMSAGRIAQPPTNDAAMRYRADLTFSMRNGGAALTDEQWNAMSKDERKLMAAADSQEASQILEGLKTMAEAQRINLHESSIIGTLAASDMATAAFTRDTASINPSADNVLVMGGMSTDHVYATDANGNRYVDRDALAPNSAVSSVWQTLNLITNKLPGLQAQLADIEQRLATLDPEAQADEGARLAAESVIITRAIEINANVRAELMRLYEGYRSGTDAAMREAIIDEINGVILNASQGLDIDGTALNRDDAEAARRAVELVFTRHPIIEGGSFTVMIPQASKAMSRANAHGQVLTHQSIIKAMGADRDGDTTVTQAFQLFPQAQLDELRAGVVQYLAPVVDDVVVGQDAQGNPITEQRDTVDVQMDAPDGEKKFISDISRGLNSGPGILHTAATDSITELVADIRERYTPFLDNAMLDRSLVQFEKDLVDGVADARLRLANALVRGDRVGMLRAGIENKMAELPWLMQRISRAWDRFQTTQAADNPGLDFTEKDVNADLPQEMAYARATAVMEMSTAGQTAQLLAEGDTPVRVAQKFHYSVYRALIDAQRNEGFLATGFDQAIRDYAQLGSDMGRSKLAEMRGRNAIQRRVASWLEDIVSAAGDTFGADANSAMLLLASTQVQDIKIVGVGQYEMGDGQISLLQLLLKRSIEIEQIENRTTLESDEDLQRKIRRLSRLAERSVDDKERSVTSQLAMLEVFGDVPMYRLLGDSARYLGAQLTPSQLLAQLGNRTDESRADQIYRWRRKAPYVMHARVGNPPYSVAQTTSGELSPYAVLVDALAAGSRTAPRERRARDARVAEQFKAGIAQLQTMVASYRRTENLGDATFRTVVERLLESNTGFATTLANLLPEAARRGIVQIQDGKGYVSNWVYDMLEQEPAKAAVTYRVNTWIAEWNALGARSDLDDADTEVGSRQYSKIRSRMLQTFYTLASQPTDFEMNRLLMVLREAPSIEALMDAVNSQPQWVAGRAELLAFFDDVADFEADPSQVWTANLPGTLTREAIENFAGRTLMQSEAMVSKEQQLRTERTLLAGIRSYMETQGTTSPRVTEEGKRYHALLDLTIQNRRLYPDHVGASVRDRFTRAIQEGVLRFHDKGKADRNVAPMGEFLVTADEFGVKQSAFQTADGLTIYDADDILTNPTKLVEGPVRVAGRDGQIVTVDLTTVEGALAALENSSTNAFAKMVLFPTARELNMVDVVGQRQDTSSDGLKSMLDEADYHDVFPRTDSRPSLAQAHKYISTLEAGIRRASIGKSEAERAESYFPIQNAINEFVLAYTHRAGGRKHEADALRAGLFIDMAHALQSLGALHRMGPGLVDEVADILKASLKARFARDGAPLRKILAGELETATTDALVIDAFANIYTRRSIDINAELTEALAAGDTARVTALQAEQANIAEVLQRRIDELDMLGQDNVVESVINQFQVTGDPHGDMARKTAILEFLGTGARKNRFQGPYALLERLNTVLADDGYALTNPDAFSDAEWKELGTWASTIYLAERVGRAGSNVDLTPLLLGPEGKQTRRYFDFTWSYLIDGLTSRVVLDAAQQLGRVAGWNPDTTPADVANIIENGLLDYKKLGEWTEVVVSKSIQARQALSQAPVGLAIPVGGELPKEAAAYVGASRRTFKRPTPDMLTTEQVSIDPTVADAGWTPVQRFKLNNHFARSVRVTATLADGSPLELELMGDVGSAWHGEESVRDSEYKLIRIDRIDHALAKIMEANEIQGNLELAIDYFDVDTMPYAEEWKNNVYFVGAGREGETPLTPSPIAELVFGVGGLSKQAQQEPLNMATKGGEGYKPTPVTMLASAQMLEGSDRVADVLLAKVMHMMNKEHDFGSFLDADMVSLYELMKMRHVVVGLNDQGKKEVWWSHRAIAEGVALNDPAFPLTEARLVPLSEAQSQSLLGEPGTKGLRGAVVEPVLNLDDMPALPEITAERLAGLELTELGNVGQLTDTDLAGLTGIPLTSRVDDSGRIGATPFEAQVRGFQERQSQASYARQGARTSQGFSPDKISEVAAARLLRMLSQESLAPLFARLGIPLTLQRDMTEVALTTQLATKLRELAEVDGNAVIWQHVQDANPDPAGGVFTQVSLKGGFGDGSDIPIHARPVLGDTVILDLDSFIAKAGGNTDTALSQAMEAVQVYARTGARIVLGGARSSELRAELGDYLRSGRDGYSQMAESAHFFAPTYQDFAVSQNRRAIDSTLTATRVFTGNSLILTHESDYYADGSSENSSYFDLRPEQPVWRGQALTLLPTHFERYGIPVEGNGANNQMAEVRARVLAMLESQEGLDFLRRHGADPEGVPLYSVVNGVESPGIRSLDDALAKLKAQLTSGIYPLTEGEEIMMGDLIPVLGVDRSIFFMRVGFQIPSVTEIDQMLKEPLDQANPAQVASNMAISTGKLQETWTVRPPGIIEKVNPDPMAGSSVQIKYDLSRFGKGIAEGDGWKTLYAPMPNDLAAPAEPLGNNGLRFNAFTGRKSRESKQAVEGQVTSFDWAFALSGVDFRSEMVEFFLGKKQRTPEETSTDWAIVKTYLDRVARMDHGFTASELSDFFNQGQFRGAFRTELTGLAEDIFGQGYNLPGFEQGAAQDPVQRLGEVMIYSLMAPRVRLSDVISTSGIATLERLDGNSKVTLMPKIFTDALEDYSHPELRDYLNAKVNAQFPRRADGTKPYFLGKDWKFYIQMEKDGQVQYVPGVAHISLEFAADENPVNYVQSALRSVRQGASQHVAFVTNEAVSARTVTERDLRQTTELFSDAGLERFDSGQGDGGFSQLMRAVPLNDQTYKPWRRATPAQRLYMQEAHVRRTAYLQPIDMTDWSEAEKAAYATLQNRILAKLVGERAEDFRTEVDYWVRQMFGIASAREGQDPAVGRVTGAAAKQAAELILANVEKNLIPTYGGVVALWDESIAAAVFEENLNRADAWAPKLGSSRKSPLAKEWDDWTKATVGQVRESDTVFISTFRYDLDGFWHTWINATEEMGTLPVSMDELVDLKLMDKDTNLVLASLDPHQEALLSNPAVFDNMRGTLNALVGYDPEYRNDTARTAPASELNQRIERIMKWQATNRVPKQEGRLSYRKYMEEGSHYIANSRDTHTFFHNMINLSVGMRLLNPALWTSAVVEVFVRNKMETLTNLATGRSTSVVGKGLARVGIEPVYTLEQIQRLNKLADTMGQDNRFLSMVYDELTFKNIVDPGHGKIGTALEKFAKFSATATSDPHFGMKAKNLAKRYLEAAMEYLDDTNSAVPFDVFMAAMNRDPRWLQQQVDQTDAADGRKIGFNAHRAGMNRIAQVRSMRQTVVGKTIMSPIDLMTQHHSWGVQATGHLLKIPFLFTRFNVNAFMALSGLTGVDQMAAMMLEGRENKIIGKLKAGMSGREYSPELDRIDMSDVLEGVDLFRPFIRGAITHTGLMAFGMMAGSLNFSGEDEETKRRRRLAHWLDTPYMYDPRRIENDVTMADAIFLDSAPDWMQSMFQVSQNPDGSTRSAVMPHWITRQFLSPIVGIERFLSTGDVRQIGWGYGDAFAAIPTSVTRIKQEADITADLLLEEARKQDGLMTSESSGNVTQLMVNVVGIYERALLENSFVNSLRSGSDAYNRNPWVKPATDEFGNIIRDPQTQAPVATDQRQLDVDENGNPVSEYDGRDAGGLNGAIMHQYAENNGTAAVLLSLFTGQLTTDSTFFRNNMVPKQETFYVPESTRADAEATILASLQGAAARGEGMENLSMYEIESTLKQQAQAKGAWWQQADITAQAKAIYARQNAAGQTGGFSLIDEKSGALLQDGANAVMQGLRSGTVKPGDEALLGVSISVPMRQKIQEQWTEELVQDGIDMGLPESVAVSRARRIWYGNTYEDPNATGLKDILWDDAIPWNTKATYNQLNVTFALGPNGRPIATPFKRNDLLQSMGIPLPSAAWTSTPGMTKDLRGNAVDAALGINLGLKALERTDSMLELPVPKDDPLAFKENGRAASDGFSSGGSGGSGWVNYGKRGYTPYRRRSYSKSGGYSSGGGYPNFSKMYALADTQTPYGNDIPFINTSNPILRRANVRRERVWSERGRLNQWQ